MYCPTCKARYEAGAFCAIDGTPLRLESGAALIGQLLADRYRIVRLLGEGGMGQVFEAQHLHINKRFALKLLKPEVVGSASSLARFRQEAWAASSIGHANIVEIDDFATLPSGEVYLAMELLDGQSLAERMRGGPPLSLAESLAILIAVGNGLAAAHDKGIVHRDMKPENIFLQRKAGTQQAKILDFGIAKVFGADEPAALTRTGAVFGTPLYMSPEQAKGRPADARADIYALGVILYECATGSVPFGGESSVEILNQQIAAQPVPPTALAPERAIPAALEAIILRALAKEPEARFARMSELVDALQSVAATLPDPASLPPVPRSMAAVAPTGPARPPSEPLPVRAAPMRRSNPPSTDAPMDTSTPTTAWAVASPPPTGASWPPPATPTATPLSRPSAAPGATPLGATPTGAPLGATPTGMPLGATPAGMPLGAVPAGMPLGAVPAAMPLGAVPAGMPPSATPTAAPLASPSQPPFTPLLPPGALTTEAALAPARTRMARNLTLAIVGLVLIAAMAWFLMPRARMQPLVTAPPPPAPTTPASPSPRPEPPALTPPAAVRVIVDSLPSGAQILRDGEVVGETPETLELSAPATLLLRKEGFVDKSATLDPALAHKLMVTLERAHRGGHPAAATSSSAAAGAPAAAGTPPRATATKSAKAAKPVDKTATRPADKDVPLEPYGASSRPAPRPAKPAGDALSSLVERTAAAAAPGSKRLGDLYRGVTSDSANRSDWFVELPLNQCFTFFGEGGDGVKALYLYLWGPTGKRVKDNRDSTPHTRMTYCTTLAGVYHFQAKVDDGAGEYRVGIYHTH